MAKIAFEQKLRMSKSNKIRLGQINSIIEEYTAKNYKLTLRQLYYQLVSRNLIANEVKEYSKLGELLTKGRMCGIVDWDSIEDRVRIPYLQYYTSSPEDAIQDSVSNFKLDRMKNQNCHIELWVEKDAISNVLKRKTQYYHIHLMVNRGYSSTTAMFDSYERFVWKIRQGKKVTVLYLGDHDPSGLDMVRDIEDRIKNMLKSHPTPHIFGSANFIDSDLEIEDYIDQMFEIKQIGLTTEQVKFYNPPPNPTKIKDPRAKQYIKNFGMTSWEVDALNPEILHKIIEDEVESIIDKQAFDDLLEFEEREKNRLSDFPDNVKKYENIRNLVQNIEESNYSKERLEKLIISIKENI